MRNGDNPAFHQATEWSPGSDLKGLTKREYFAAIAMQAILSSFDDKYNEKSVANNSIKMADELLKELES